MSATELKGYIPSEYLPPIENLPTRITVRYAKIPSELGKDEEEMIQSLNGFEKCMDILSHGEFVANPDRTGGLFIRSGFNKDPKWTHEVGRCSVVIFSGRSENDEVVSGLIHVNPLALESGSSFNKKYDEYLDNFALLTEPSSRMSIVAGGAHFNIFRRFNEPRMPLFERKMKAGYWFSSKNNRRLGLRTHLFSPKTNYGHSSVYFDTQEHQVYIIDILNGLKKPVVEEFVLPKSNSILLT